MVATQYRPVLKGFETKPRHEGEGKGEQTTQYRPVLKGFETKPPPTGPGPGKSTQYRPVLKGFETRIPRTLVQVRGQLRSTAPF